MDLAKIGLESVCGKVKYMYEFVEDILDIEKLEKWCLENNIRLSRGMHDGEDVYVFNKK